MMATVSFSGTVASMSAFSKLNQAFKTEIFDYVLCIKLIILEKFYGRIKHRILSLATLRRLCTLYCKES
jgi:hypothetical protein